jgi:hypothetical protein
MSREEELREAVDRIGQAYADVRNAMSDLDRELVRLDVILSPWGGEKR